MITQQQYDFIEQKISGELIKLGNNLADKSGKDYIVMQRDLKDLASEGRSLLNLLETFLPPTP